MFNPIDFCKDYSIPTATSENKNVGRNWLGICCPFCGDDNYHGGFNLKDGYYSCWKCGHHTIREVIITILGCSQSEANRIYKSYNDNTPVVRKKRKEKWIRQKNLELPKGCKDLYGMYKNYLLKRRFNPDLLQEKYKLKASSIIGDYKYRIIAPIFYNGRMVSFQGRDITGKANLRYKTCSKDKEIIHHKHILYNLDNCRNDYIIIVEGITDVWRIGNDSAGTFGIEYTSEQVQLLITNYRKHYIWFDPDADVMRNKLCNDLAFFGYDPIIINKDVDPADMSDKEIQLIRKEFDI